MGDAGTSIFQVYDGHYVNLQQLLIFKATKRYAKYLLIQKGRRKKKPSI